MAVLGTVLVSNTNAANLEETNAPLKSTIIVPNPLMMANNPNVLNAHAMIPPQDELETLAMARQFGYGRPYGYGGGLGGYGGLYGPGFGGYGGGLGYGGGMGYGGYGRPYGGYGYGGRPYGFGK